MGNESTLTAAVTSVATPGGEEEVVEEGQCGRMSPARPKQGKQVVPLTAAAAACMERLPLGIISHVLSFLSAPDLLNVACVNRDLCWMVEDNRYGCYCPTDLLQNLRNR